MADNIMGGSDPTIDMSVALRLTNIEDSSRQIDSLINQTEEWKKSIEAVGTALGGTYEALQSLGTATLNYRDIFQDVVDLSERNEATLRRSAENARELAQASRDIQTLFTNTSMVNGMLPGMMENREVGSGYGGYGGPNSSTYGGPQLGGAETYGVPQISAGGGGGLISKAIQMGKSVLSQGAEMQYWTNMNQQQGNTTAERIEEDLHIHPVAAASRMLLNTGPSASSYGAGPLPGMNSGIPIPGMIVGGGSSSRNTSPASARERLIDSAMNIPFYMPGGKLAYGARFINRVLSSGPDDRGPIKNWLSRQNWMFGTEGEVPLSESEMDAAIQAARAARVEQTYRDYEMSPLYNKSMATSTRAGIEEDVGKLSAQALGIAATKTELSGGLIGAGRAALPFLSKAAVPLMAAKFAYDAASMVNRGAQQYGAVTGQTDTWGAFGNLMGTRANAFGDSFLSFGRMDSQTAMEIRMGAEAAGYRRGSGLYSDYVGFGKQSYEKFMMSPQESLAMFNTSVIQAGNTVTTLSDNLSTLAKVASTTNTSFGQLRQNYDYYTQTLVAGGLRGGLAGALATSASTMYANDPLMAGKGTTLSMLGSQQGIALASMAMGINVQDYYRVTSTPSGSLAAANGADQAGLMLLGSIGLTATTPNLKDALNGAKLILPSLLTNAGITNPDGTPWNPTTAAKFAENLITGKSSTTGNMVKNTTKALQEYAGKGVDPTSKEGVENFFKHFANAGDKRSFLAQTWDIGPFGSHDFREVYRDKNINHGKVITSWSSLSSEQQKKLRSDLALNTNVAQMALGKFNSVTGEYMGVDKKHHWRSLGAASGDKLLGNLSDSRTIVELGPQAKKLLQIIGNPTAYNNAYIQDQARNGGSSNSYQDPSSVTSGYDFGVG